MIYLDHNATTPVDGEVKDAVCNALNVFGNPSSTHILGRRAHEVIEQARASVAEVVSARAEEVIFTSGGTESNNLAIIGFIQSFGKGHIVSSKIEHPSVINPLKFLQKHGYGITLVGTDCKGMVSPEDILKALRPDTVLVTIMHSNNETGVLQPVREIAGMLRERGVVFHTDAAQSIGKIPLNVEEPGPDMMTIVSHKFYGPKGVGALYVKKGIKLHPVMHGAGHEGGLRPGTENVPGITGLGKASEISKRDIDRRVEHTKMVTEMLYQRLLELIPEVRLNGDLTQRLPNTLNISIKGITGAGLVESIRDKVAISAGSACHSGICTPSEVLLSMGLNHSDALSAVRISTGKDTTEEEVKEASELIDRKSTRLNSSHTDISRMPSSA